MNRFHTHRMMCPPYCLLLSPDAIRFLNNNNGEFFQLQYSPVQEDYFTAPIVKAPAAAADGAGEGAASSSSDGGGGDSASGSSCSAEVGAAAGGNGAEEVVMGGCEE